MICPSCQQNNTDEAEVCFTCGKALHALTQGAVVASRYVIRQLLGRGGMGYVYRAFDRMLEEEVAIKTLRAELVREPEMARRFRSEIRLARKVSHRNVCRIHEYGEDGPLSYLSMEFVEGVDLKRLLRDGPLTPELGFEVGIEAADGLQAVHGHGIIHRDLKPSNVMVDRRGVVRLMDFGIAKEAESETSLTGSGLIGTPEYMSPEQAEGGKVGYASDVYSLGCLLHEVFLGVPPFHAETPLNTLYMHIHDPPPLRGREGRVPEALEPILRRALAKKPVDRYAASGLAQALREARDALGLPAGDLAAAVAVAIGLQPAAREDRPRAPAVVPASAPRPSSTEEPGVTSTIGNTRRRSRSRSRWRWAIGALAGAAALAFLANALRPRKPLDAPPPTVTTTPSTVSLPASSVAAAPLARSSPSARPTPGRPSAPARPSPSGEPVGALIAGAAKPGPASQPVSSPKMLGVLSLVIVPPAEVLIDDASLGIVSIREVSLAAGPHAVRILHADFKPLQRKVTIQPGLTERLVLDLSQKAIRRPTGPRE